MKQYFLIAVLLGALTVATVHAADASSAATPTSDATDRDQAIFRLLSKPIITADCDYNYFHLFYGSFMQERSHREYISDFNAARHAYDAHKARIRAMKEKYLQDHGYNSKYPLEWFVAGSASGALGALLTLVGTREKSSEKLIAGVGGLVLSAAAFLNSERDRRALGEIRRACEHDEALLEARSAFGPLQKAIDESANQLEAVAAEYRQQFDADHKLPF